MSRLRIGIAVAGEMLAGVLEANGHLEDPVLDRASADESLGAAVARLLNVLVTRGRRAEVCVAFLDERCCAAPLFGVAPDTDAAAVERELAGLPTAFFLGVPGSLRAGNVWLHNGAWHGAVVDRDAAAAVQGAVKASGARLVGVRTLDSATDLTTAAALALDTRSEDPGVVDLEREERERRRIGRRRRGLGTAIVLLSAWSLYAPTFGLRAELSRQERRLDALRAERDSLALALRSNAVGPSLVVRIAELGADRAQVRAVLRALAQALPDSTAVVALRQEEHSGAATLLSADAARAVAQLAGRAELSSLRVAGAITTEGGEGSRLERVNIVWGTRVSPAPRTARAF